MKLAGKGKAARFGLEDILVVLPGGSYSEAEGLINALLTDCSKQDVMNPEKYKKVCIDFSVKAGILEVREKTDLESIIESARKAQKIIAKMECHRG